MQQSGKGYHPALMSSLRDEQGNLIKQLMQC